MTENQLILASDTPLRIGGLQFALCAAQENFQTAEWIENRRKQGDSFHINGAEARRSMAHHHCGIGLEFAFKVLYALETLAKSGIDSEQWTGHRLADALEKISTLSDGLRSLYEEHCAGRLEPIALCVGRHPEYVEKANLDTLNGFCEYVDQLGMWATARYDHWQKPGVWMYRVADLAPVLAFGNAAVALANQAQEPVTLRLVKDDEDICLSNSWILTMVKKERTRVPHHRVELRTESLAASQCNGEL